MFNYRLINTSGDVLGVVSLETEDLPKLLVAGEKMLLSASWDVNAAFGTNANVDFVVSPEPVSKVHDHVYDEFGVCEVEGCSQYEMLKDYHTPEASYERKRLGL